MSLGEFVGSVVLWVGVWCVGVGDDCWWRAVSLGVVEGVDFV